MKVLALPRYGALGASSRLRTQQYLPLLRSMGMEVQVEPLLDDAYLQKLYAGAPTDWSAVLRSFLRRLSRLGGGRRFDLLWFEKELFPYLPAWFERGLTALSPPYVVDFDDAIFHNYDLSGNPYKRLLGGKIDRIMRGAALVLCGNEYLADHARRAGAGSIALLPTVVDLSRYPVAERGEAARGLTVGWIGSPATVKYLDIVVPVLQSMARRLPLQLRVIGADFVSPGLDVDCRPWSEASEAVEIGLCDVGIMPLQDLPWERGKCGYKLIQYMACGLPVIASPVGVNSEIVVPEHNGFLAGGREQWRQALERLEESPELRRKMGRAGRAKVERDYSLAATAPRLAALLEGAARRGAEGGR